jgi:hypothetical protein
MRQDIEQSRAEQSRAGLRVMEMKHYPPLYPSEIHLQTACERTAPITVLTTAALLVSASSASFALWARTSSSFILSNSRA